MTNPVQHNCKHSESGWCLQCVSELARELDVLVTGEAQLDSEMRNNILQEKNRTLLNKYLERGREIIALRTCIEEGHDYGDEPTCRRCGHYGPEDLVHQMKLKIERLENELKEHVEQMFKLFFDRIVYGTCFVQVNKDGTYERVDPMNVTINNDIQEMKDELLEKISKLNEEIERNNKAWDEAEELMREVSTCNSVDPIDRIREVCTRVRIAESQLRADDEILERK